MKMLIVILSFNFISSMSFAQSSGELIFCGKDSDCPEGYYCVRGWRLDGFTCQPKTQTEKAEITFLIPSLNQTSQLFSVRLK